MHRLSGVIYQICQKQQRTLTLIKTELRNFFIEYITKQAIQLYIYIFIATFNFVIIYNHCSLLLSLLLLLLLLLLLFLLSYYYNYCYYYYYYYFYYWQQQLIVMAVAVLVIGLSSLLLSVVVVLLIYQSITSRINLYY